MLEKDSEASENKKEKYKSLALKAKKVSSDEEVSCWDSDDKEYAMAVRDFKKFFRRRVIVPNTPTMTNRHSLEVVGAIVKKMMTLRRTKFVSWHTTQMKYFGTLSIIVVLL
ncbi:hypothetical protein Tco_0574934 [Tanacetum coccineum]